jgi:hypothetical protein
MNSYFLVRTTGTIEPKTTGPFMSMGEAREYRQQNNRHDCKIVERKGLKS